MASQKMYRVDPIVNIADILETSQVMYRTKIMYNLPTNIKETYYDDQLPTIVPSPSVDSFLKHQNMVGENPQNTTMEKIKQRQECILEKLKHIKQTLHNFKGRELPTSSAEYESLNVAQQIQGLYFSQKIDALKHYLLDAKKLQNHLVQSVEQVERWQEFVLKQLVNLRDDMKVMAEQNQAATEIKKDDDLKSRQRMVLEIIDGLQILLKMEITSLQIDIKDNLIQINIEEYHTEVLKLIDGLQEEFEQILKIFIWQPIEKSGIIKDIVVSTNPASPPYFLLPVKKLLQQSDVKVLSMCSIHSSIEYVDPKIMKLFKDDFFKERGSHDVSLTVIWKEQNMKSVMVSPLKQCAIVGEANILRYISRLLPATSPLNYESQGSFAMISEMDYCLDTIQSKLLHGVRKERQSFLKQMNSKLGTSSWIGGDRFGLCDIFCWSVILQLSLTSTLPSNMSSWFKRLNETFALAELAQLQGKINESDCCVTPFDRHALEDFLKRHGIQYQSRNHEEVFTVEGLMDCVRDMPGIHMKNLFLKDRKNKLYLLAARHDIGVKLNDVATQVEAKDLRFADEDLLFQALGVKRGCVTVFALLNDREHAVTLLLDAEVTKTDKKYVNFHPLRNDATLGVSPHDLLKFIDLTGHAVRFIELSNSV